MRSEKKLIATVGVEDLVITESGIAILVDHKDRGQDVKKIIARPKAENWTEIRTKLPASTLLIISVRMPY